MLFSWLTGNMHLGEMRNTVLRGRIFALKGLNDDSCTRTLSGCFGLT